MDEPLQSLLQQARADRFDNGFVHRVLQRAAADRNDLGQALARCFYWLAPVAVAAIAVLVVHNSRVQGASGISGLLALPSVTLESAYSPYEATTP